MSLHVPTYWKHVITVLGGALGAQALPLLAAPLITRLCSPAEMGAFMVWFGIVAVAAIGATLRLEAAMILDHGSEHQATCFNVVAWSATVTAVLVTLGVMVARALGWRMVASLSWGALLTLGLGTWLTAYMQTTLAYATSRNAFGTAARAKILGAGSIALSQVALLWAGAGSNALLGGHLAGLTVGLAAATVLLQPPRPRLSLRPTAAMRQYLHRHRAFWRFSLPSNLLNVVVGQLPLLMIGARYGALAAGLFALTQRVLSAPVALLASSVLEVFKRQSVHDFQTHGNCREAYRYTFKALALLGIGPSLVLLLFSPQLFGWVFGANWRAAGEMAQILAPLYFLNFIASPLSYVFFVAGKQKMDLIWQIALCSMTLGVFLAPGTLQQSLARYAIGYSLLYLVYLHMSWQCSQNRTAAA
ncbi:lipopolysaccharide biosynthesis protein [Massilia sp. CF038]|uniref:lipopolysaccharide biosynthesis protein n=1 Tax=Massilia sp. CF038 TaxID=1881045 RepID=UPI00091FC9AE|nr:oligosaccharide flippase family protein [Massilia sp. CF038]SHH02489.1 Membrane protein involved in the export of O-antigen and teichoic acid [Massilia sp. CF038]